MEFFPDGGFVRLQSRETIKYVHADGDWLSVTTRQIGTVPLEAVWRVEHQPHFAQNDQGQVGVYVLLQNAAYGRYLSFSPFHGQHGHRGRRAVQSARHEQPYNVLNAYRWSWRVERVDPNQNYVRLFFADSDLGLRANGKYRTRNTGVTIDRRRDTTMMQWTVHAVPQTPVPLPLQPQPQQFQRGHRRRGLLFWRHKNRNRGPGVYQHPGQAVRYVLANDQGDFDQNHQNWHVFASYDHSVLNLRTHLEEHHPDSNRNMLNFTLCIRPGLHGRLMPLVVDLPRSLDVIHIVVLRTGSPAAAELVYPQIDAPAQ